MQRPRFMRRRDIDDGASRHEAFQHTAESAVSDFAHRFYEDPEFKDSFVSTMRETILDHRQASVEESKAHAEAYGDSEGHVTRDGLHETRGSAFLSIIDLLTKNADPERYYYEAPSPEHIANEIRRIVGRLASEAYFEGQIDPPLQLQDGGIGVVYEGFGTVVHWEKVRGIEKQLDGISDRMNPPQDT